MTNALDWMAFRNVIMLLQERLLAVLQSRRYTGPTYCNLNYGYHNSPTIRSDCHCIDCCLIETFNFLLVVHCAKTTWHQWLGLRLHPLLQTNTIWLSSLNHFMYSLNHNSCTRQSVAALCLPKPCNPPKRSLLVPSLPLACTWMGALSLVYQSLTWHADVAILPCFGLW